MLEMRIAPQRAVQMSHTGREVLREVINVSSGDLGPINSRAAASVASIRGDEVLGEMVQYGSKTVVLVKAR